MCPTHAHSAVPPLAPPALRGICTACAARFVECELTRKGGERFLGNSTTRNGTGREAARVVAVVRDVGTARPCGDGKATRGWWGTPCAMGRRGMTERC